ncbi:chlorophyllide a oxygenase, chloroplastic [Dorcoceras hygrometricum]|uniref:Chlorophyllide a oxygenase, chloroplastic n=1 Tax=Dorcoceras hygrometricum TaxID=472368 RepID=A0A2Z7C452_9LAMI|nr:chlorophyllide a oxygenase, chloroplastic [Dorcoceras hygrometricum]
MLCYAMLCSVMLCSDLSKLCLKSVIQYMYKNEEQTLGNGPLCSSYKCYCCPPYKQLALDNQDRTIRRLRAQLATERRVLAATKKELKETQVTLEASHKSNHVECHQKFQARIHEAEDSMQAQHLLIEALVDEKDNLLQTIHDLQEANNAPAPFDGDWEEEPEEEPEEIEDIPLGEGEIDDD